MEWTHKRYASTALLGRVLLATIFIVSGLSKIPSWDQTLAYMSSQGIPFPQLLLFPAIFIEVLGGLSVLFGFRARQGAAVLAIYLIPVTLMFHNFWSYGGMDRQLQMINFLKNLAIMGGLCIVSAFGAGAVSLDNRFPQRRSPSTTGRDRLRVAS